MIYGFVFSVAPSISHNGLIKMNTAAVKISEKIVRAVRFIEKKLDAPLSLPSPLILATTVEVPTAEVIEIAKSAAIKGDEILTAASAVELTPRATKMLSTIE